MPRTRPSAAHRRRYVLSAQVGLIGSLLLLIGLFSIRVTASPPTLPPLTERDGIVVPEVVPVTRHDEARRTPAPPPPLPPVVGEDLPEDELPPIPLDEFLLSPDAPTIPPIPPRPPEPEAEEAFEERVFERVEQAPELIGGLAGLAARVRYPEMARRAHLEGTVFVRFVVGPDGSVGDAECVRDPGAGLCEAALEAVRASQFEPGRQRGVPVRVRMTLPVRFRLR